MRPLPVPNPQGLLNCDLAVLAPAGHYLALRIGFGSPVVEVNKLPVGWVDEYTRNGYAPFDPLIRWVHTEVGAIRWSAVEHPDHRGIMTRAKAHRMNFGAVVSIRDANSGLKRSFGTFAHHDREFSDDELIQFQEHVQSQHAAMLPPPNLTEAEVQALSLVKGGQRLKQIAWHLEITEGAVKQRLRNARQKLSAKTVTEAVAKASVFQLL
jgi:LuxR family transcriptional regulator